MTTQPASPTPTESTAEGAAEGTAPLPERYEQARDELTAVVEKLEAGGLDLDESLTLWERGQALAAACETFLAGARERVDAALAQDTGDIESGKAESDDR